VVELKSSRVILTTANAWVSRKELKQPLPGFSHDLELALARLLFVVAQVGSIVRSGVQAVARPAPAAARRKVRWLEHQLAVDAKSEFSLTFAVVNGELRFG